MASHCGVGGGRGQAFSSFRRSVSATAVYPTVDFGHRVATKMTVGNGLSVVVYPPIAAGLDD